MNKRIVITEKNQSGNVDLIDRHVEGTKFCNFMRQMRSNSPTYEEIILKDESIVPDILRYMQNNPEKSGMSVMLLLWDILKMSPYEPEKVTNEKGETIPVMGFKVDDAVKSWLDWGIKEGYIKEKQEMSKEKLKGIEPDLNGNVYFIAQKNTRSVKKGHIAFKLSGDGNYEVINNGTRLK